MAGCGQWRYSLSDNNNVSCSESENLRSIQLRGLTLPNRPAADPNEGYPVAIQWGNNRAFTGKNRRRCYFESQWRQAGRFRANPSKFEGSGFSDGVTVNLYAQPGTSSVACTNAGGAGWDQHRFPPTWVPTIASSRRSTSPPMCSVPPANTWSVLSMGAGVHSGTTLIIEVEVGLEVVGAGSGIEFQPGQQITLSIEGGGSNLGIESIPRRRAVVGPRRNISEPATISSSLSQPAEPAPLPWPLPLPVGKPPPPTSPSRAFDLLVQGVGAAGISMGQTAVASASNLPGNQVCNVTLAGIRLAFLGRRPH